MASAASPKTAIIAVPSRLTAKDAWEKYYSRHKPALKEGQQARWAVVEVRGRRFLRELESDGAEDLQTEDNA